MILVHLMLRHDGGLILIQYVAISVTARSVSISSPHDQLHDVCSEITTHTDYRLHLTSMYASVTSFEHSQHLLYHFAFQDPTGLLTQF